MFILNFQTKPYPLGGGAEGGRFSEIIGLPLEEIRPGYFWRAVSWRQVPPQKEGRHGKVASGLCQSLSEIL